MTWSIIARDAETGAFGVAIATRSFAVGALCPHARGGVGALATQALVNPTFGPRGLRLLAEGIPAPQVEAALIASDEGRAERQLHLIDRWGVTAAHTDPLAELARLERVRAASDAPISAASSPAPLKATGCAHGTNSKPRLPPRWSGTRSGSGCHLRTRPSRPSGLGRGCDEGGQRRAAAR